MERMNKEELIKLVESLKIDKKEFWILSSGMLVLRGLYPDAGDLDIGVTNKGFKQLQKNYDLKAKGNGFYIVMDNVECVCDGEIDDLKYKPQIVDGYQVQNIYDYYEFVKNSGREKDKPRIPIVEKYIKEQSE